MAILILARSYREAERYAKIRGIPRAEWQYIIDWSVLRGKRKAIVRRVGEWYMREDLSEVEMMIKTQQCTVEDA